jgi:GTP-binding protein EngB required for normal cell division
MDPQQNRFHRVPQNAKFRILAIGRANAGMTSVLQKVCDTTQSPEIYGRVRQGKRERVRSFLTVAFHLKL